jgi:hypothetical protein
MFNVKYIVIYSPTKVKHHLTCFNNIFSNNELISNRFAVFVTCTHILTYLWNRLLVDFYLCVYGSVTFPVWRKRCISRTMMEWLTLKWSATLLWLKPPLCMPTACHLSGMYISTRTVIRRLHQGMRARLPIKRVDSWHYVIAMLDLTGHMIIWDGLYWTAVAAPVWIWAGPLSASFCEVYLHVDGQ